MHKALRAAVVITLAFLPLSGVGRAAVGRGALKDPGIPDGEKITYRTTTGDVVVTSVETTRIVEKNGASFYKISSKSDSEEVEVMIRRGGMRPVSVRSLSKGKDGTIDRRTEIVEETGGEDGSVKIMDMQSLVYILRGFPFSKGGSIPLRTLGNTQGTFTMQAKLDGVDKLTTPAGEFKSYRIEISFGGGMVGGMIGMVTPKIYFWYSFDPPHFMVRYRGAAGPPGSPARTVEVVDYHSQD
jgi:hypothetical protein